MPRTRLVPPATVRLNRDDDLLDWVQFDAQRYVSQQMHADFMDAVMQDAMTLAAQPVSAAMTAESMLESISAIWRELPDVRSQRLFYPGPPQQIPRWVLDNPLTAGHPKSSTKTGDDKMARPEVGTILACSVNEHTDINDGGNRLFYVKAHDGEDTVRLITLSDTDYDYAGDEYGGITANLDDDRFEWMSINAAEKIKPGIKAYAKRFDRENYKPSVGDKVLVDKPANLYEHPCWTTTMDKSLGRVLTVTDVSAGLVTLDDYYNYNLTWVQPVAIVDRKKKLRLQAQKNINDKLASWDKHDLRRNRRKYHWGKATGERIAALRAKATHKNATEADVAEYLFFLRGQARWMGTKVEPALYIGRDKIYNDTWESVGIPEHRIDALHCLHVSTEDNSKIAYYPTLRHMREGREVRTTLGKYLTKYKDVFEYDENTIRNLAQKFIAMQTGSGYKLHFKEQDDPDGWVEVYNKGPHSCMKGEDATRIYASGVSNLRLAYLTDFDGDIVARCIVRDSDDPKVKGYVRVYPDPNGEPEGRRLKDLLEEAGYGNRTDIKGCLLSFIEDGSNIVCPYLDYGNGDMSQVVECYVHEGKTYLRAGYGHIGAASTSGYAEGYDQDVCACCDEYTDTEDLTEVRGGNYVCGTCINEHYVEAYARYSYTEWVHEDRAIRCETNGAYYHDAFLVYHDIYQCEYTDDYYHIDDLEMTSRGYVIVEECVELDVPDDDGNDWAVKGDTVTLEDGRVVHEDMAEKDWITGEWLLADEDEDGVIQIFARQMTSSRGIAQCAYVYTTLEALADSIDDWVVEFTPRFSSGRYVQSVSCIAFKDAVEPGSAVINFRDLTYDMIRSDATFERIFEYLDEHGLVEAREEAA